MTPPAPPVPLEISVRTGSGHGPTVLAAFDHALQRAGVADLNLVTLSSVIPPGSRIVRLPEPAAALAAGHGDVLVCVLARAEAVTPGATAWAGLGWVVDDVTGGGLFVEHHAESEERVRQLVHDSLEDMRRRRGGGYGPVQLALAAARCEDRPVSAVVVATYQAWSWGAAGPVAVASTATDDVSAADRPRSPVAAGAPGLSVLSRVPGDTAEEIWSLYRECFVVLEDKAAARQLISREDFLAEVLDERIDKLLVRDGEGRVVGLTTLTTHLDAVPWISPAFFAARYPDEHARGALHYLGFTLVKPDQQGRGIFEAMVAAVTDRVLPQRGVVAWDMCRLRQEQGLSAGIDELLRSLADVKTAPVDEQTYFASTFRGPLPGAPASRVEPDR